MIVKLLVALTTLCADVFAQKTLVWMMNPPTNYVLSMGDQIKVPLEDYVNYKGAEFVVNSSQTSFVVRNVNATTSLDLNQGSDVRDCSLMTQISNIMYMVCQDKFFVSVTIDHKLQTKTAFNYTKLKSTLLNENNQKCSDMYFDNGIAYVCCTDDVAGNIVFFMVNTANLQIKGTRCQQSVSYTYPRVVPLPFSAGKNFVAIFEATPTNAIQGNTSFSTCTLDIFNTFNDTSSTASVTNLASLYSSVTMNHTIRGISLISSSEVLFVLSNQSDPAISTVQFMVANIDTNGAFASSLFTLGSWNPGSMMTFLPSQFGVGIENTQTGNLVSLADLTMLYVLNITFDRTNATQFVVNVGQPSYTPLDCGKQADALPSFVSKVTTYTRNAILPEEDRKLIEYRSTTSGALTDFAVVFTQSKYGCSKASAIGIPLKSAMMASPSMVVANGGTRLYYFSIQPSSYLQFNTSALTPGTYNLGISALLPGFTSATTPFSFMLIANSSDYSMVNLSTKTWNIFAGSKTILPLSSSSFVCNNPNFTTDSPYNNALIYYTRSFTPSLTIPIPTNYIISKLVAGDDVTSIAVLKRTGFPTSYLLVFAKLNTSGVTVTTSAQPLVLGTGQDLFKVFPLGPFYMCLVFKGFSADVPKLSVTCVENKVNGTVILSQNIITNVFEVNQMETYKSSERVDLLMVGISLENGYALNKFLHYYLALNVDGTIMLATDTKIIPVNHPAINGYDPQDIQLDYVSDESGSNKIAVKMYSQTFAPIVAKFNLSFDGNVPTLTYLRKMTVSLKDFTYCPVLNEIIVWSPRTNLLYSQQFEQPIGIPLEDKYMYPIAEYSIVKIDRLICMPEKAMFQVLAYDSNKNRVLMSFKGGRSWHAARRVHSVLNLDPATNFVSSVAGENYIATFSGGPGLNDVKRGFTYIYNDGPYIFVDHTARTTGYSFNIQAKSPSGKSSQDMANFNIIPQVNSSNASVITKLDSVKNAGTINLETALNFTSGPVVDFILNGDSNGSFNLTRRNNKNKPFATGETNRPNRIEGAGDFLGALYFRSALKIYGDPAIQQPGATAPQLILNYTGSIRNFSMTPIGTAGSVAVIVKEFINGQFSYSVILLNRTVDGSGKATYTSSISSKIYQIKRDFKDLHVVEAEGNLVIAMRSSTKMIATNFRLAYFTWNNGAFTLKSVASGIAPTDKPISAFSIVYLRNQKVAIIGGSFGNPGLWFGTWNFYSSQSYLVETTKQIIFSPTVSAKYAFDHISCWGLDVLKFECAVDSEGNADFLVEINFDPMGEINGELVANITKVGDFEIPMRFQVSRFEKGVDTYSALLSPNPAAYEMNNGVYRRLLQTKTIDSLNMCNNLIMSYKPRQSKYVFTGLTCSEWGNASVVDFELLPINGKDYIFYTMGADPIPAGRRLLQQGGNSTNPVVSSNFIANASLKILNQNFDPAQITLGVVGLNGQTSNENQNFPLSNLQNPNPPAPASSSSWWIWLLVILLILAVIGGGVYAYMKFSSKPTGGYSADTSYVAKDGKAATNDDRL